MKTIIKSILNFTFKYLLAIGLICFFMPILISITNTDVWTQYGSFERTIQVIHDDLLYELNFYKSFPIIGPLFKVYRASQGEMDNLYHTAWINFISLFSTLFTFKLFKESYSMVSNFIDRKLHTILFFLGDFIGYPLIFIFAVIAKHMLKMYLITEFLYKRGAVLTFIFIVCAVLVLSYLFAFIRGGNRITRSQNTINTAGKILCDLLWVILLPLFALWFSESVLSINTIPNNVLLALMVISFIVTILVYFVKKNEILNGN